ncbi:rod-binding protein, partial [Acinetobacter baumannii]|uniref:rod-binding protein n=1 Tax=Acinetobacter baumannii TaxID=470 RepID=UPI0013D5D08E
SNAQNFEQVFLNTMLGQMFNGLGTEAPLGGKQTEAWRGMLVDEYAKTITAQGGVGLASNIYRELIGAQEAAPRRLPPVPRT